MSKTQTSGSAVPKLDELSRPLLACLEAVSNCGQELPKPSEGVQWQDLTDVVSHLTLMRLSRASLIRPARAHEERMGTVDCGGRGRWRTTRKLMALLKDIDEHYPADKKYDRYR